MKKLIWPALLVLLLALALWWVFPLYQPAKYFRCVPADAQVVTLHSDVPARLPALLQHPLIRESLKAADKDPAELQALLTDKSVQRWLRAGAGHDILLAAVDTPSGTPGLLAVIWIGRAAPALRGALKLPAAAREVTPLPPHGKYPIWTLRSASSPAGSVYFTMAGPLLIAGVGRDASVLNRALDTLGGKAPSYLDRHGDDVRRILKPPVPAADRALIQANGPQLLLCTAFTPGQLEYQLWKSGAAASNPPAIAQQLGRETEQVLGNIPVFAGLFSGKRVLDNLPPGTNRAPALVETANFIRHLEPQAVFVALLTDNYCGSAFGLRIPTLVIGLAPRNPATAMGEARRWISLLNTRANWQLSLQRFGEAAPVYAIQSAGDMLYARLKPGEETAFTLKDSWMIFASDRAVLQKLLEPRPAESAPPAWAAPSGGEALWMDLQRGRKAMRLLLTAYYLQATLQGTDDAGTVRLIWKLMTAWTDVLSQYRTARAGWLTDAQGERLVVSFGDPK